MGLIGDVLGGVADLETAVAQKKVYKSLNPVRPTYTIPTADTAALQTAQNAADTTALPGQGLYQNQINQTTAAGANKLNQTGGTVGEIVNGLDTLNRNALNSTNSLAEAGAQMNQQNKQLYEQQANNYAQDENTAFSYNKNDPYQTQFLQKQAAKNAWYQNRGGAFSSFGNAVDSGVSDALSAFSGGLLGGGSGVSNAAIAAANNAQP